VVKRGGVIIIHKGDDSNLVVRKAERDYVRSKPRWRGKRRN
jgi:hypothetical protein